MTSLANESSPYVSLTHGLDLAPVEVAALTASNATTDPEKSYREALLAYRTYAIRALRDELLASTVLNDTIIRRAADNAWQLFFPAFKKATGPMIAEAYIRGFHQVEREQVPIQLIYQLADEHAERVGRYFNDTSTDALIQGFNTYVNKQVPQRAAIERVIDAYGLTPRQMSGYTSATALNPQKMQTSIPQRLKRKVMAYIGRCISDRLNVFQRQEAHNLNMQAQQVAWMWMVQHGKLPAHTQKMWLTAHDEKTCAQCAPMDRKTISIGEQFVMPNGNRFYVPGAHVNCRCQVRLHIPVQLVSKAEEWNPKEHPRGGNPKNTGQFSRAEGQSQRLEEAERETTRLEGEQQLRRAYRAETRQPEVAVAEAPTVSPQVEDLLRQVQEMRERERQQRIEQEVTQELKPKVSLRPKVSIAKPNVSLKPQAAPPVEKPKVSLAPPAEKPAEKPKVSLAPPVEESAVKPTVGFRKPMARINYERLVQLQDARQTADQRETLQPSLVRRRPTRQITDRFGEPTEGRIVLDPNLQMSPWAESVTLTDKDQVRVVPLAERAQWQRNQIMDQWHRGVQRTFNEQPRSGGMFQITTQVPDEDRSDKSHEVSAEIEADIVMQLITMAPLMKRREGYDELYDGEIAADVTWYNSETGEDEGEASLSWRELMQIMKINPDNYVPVVAFVEEGYGDAVPTSHDFDTWSAPGVYTVSNLADRDLLSNGGDERTIPFKRVKLTPVVRETLHVEDAAHEEPPDDLPHDRH